MNTQVCEQSKYRRKGIAKLATTAITRRKKLEKLSHPRHVVRHNNLEKLCLEGAVEGRRGRGRPRRRWTQDISDWLGFSVREASILAQDRDGFRSAVWEATSYKDPP
ncbi:eukaryotic translation initiation factor 3 subunit F [Elysia marginata]|uniref:Eukaryotic translation initiation factor 3 subunit F n=1 Tax=Elysia marginata TaxID=1093978 RepID=A0AAV4H070_9GAST|nr:eukaryotic translation initiation factor 3 subunit F [Elysia marginata]